MTQLHLVKYDVHVYMSMVWSFAYYMHSVAHKDRASNYFSLICRVSIVIGYMHTLETAPSE